jgi:hypothetical protein
MFFTDWRFLDIDIIPMDLDKSRMYYIHAQAWGLKGYLGGTHSWTTFYSKQHDSWLVVELSDLETIMVQGASIVYVGNPKDIFEHSPFITKRPYNSRWFSKDPVIVDSCPTVEFEQILSAVKAYPFKKFKLLYRNCNTFTSYLIYKLNLPLHRSIKSIGFRSKHWWRKHATEI